MEQLFSKVLQVNVRNRDDEERKTQVCVTVERTTSPVHKRDLLVRLTDATDPFFLFKLSISEEDFQSLKVQQGLLVDFAAFPQKFIDLLNLCFSEQEVLSPRCFLHLSYQSAVLEGHASLSVLEDNAFKRVCHLSLKFVQGSGKEVTDYLAVCLTSLKAEIQALDIKKKTSEEDLSRQLNYAQQTVSEKTKELDRVRCELTNQISSLSSQHSQELQLERAKSLELQNRLQLQTEQLRQDLESANQKSSQQLHSRVTELESSNRELIEQKYKNEAAIRDLKSKLIGSEEECERLKQQVLSLRRENSILDSEVHEKERLTSQMQMKAAVFEQEIKDKDQLMRRTKEVLEVTQQQKESLEENVEGKELQNQKLKENSKILSEDIKKANEIMKKLMDNNKTLAEKNKIKNISLINQEKALEETSENLKKAENDLQSTRHQLSTKDEQMLKLTEQLETATQKLNESKGLLKEKENVISWLNKKLNEKQLSGLIQSPESVQNAAQHVTPGLRVYYRPQTGTADKSPEQRPTQMVHRESGPSAALDSKYFERRNDCITVHGLPSDLLHTGVAPRAKVPVASAYFPPIRKK